MADEQQHVAASTDSTDSVYARNRAIYEASLAASASQQQQQQNHQNGKMPSDPTSHSNGGTPTYSFDPTSTSSSKKQARPRSDSTGEADADSTTGHLHGRTTAGGDGGATGDGAPARKKLIRAGDLEAAKSAAAAAATATATTTAASGSANAPVSDQPSSNGQGVPAMQPQQQQQQYPHQQQAHPPAAVPDAARRSISPDKATASADLEQQIEINALAFVQKNPTHILANVKQALRHSRGVFDQNFQTAMQLLLQNQGASSGPAAAPAAHRSPSRGHGTPLATPQPGLSASPQPPSTGTLYPHQVPLSGNSPNLAQAINGKSSAQQASQGQQSPAPSSATPLPPMPMVPPPPIIPGTHPDIGFSALQVLPAAQHQQFMALAPHQQIDYSMQVFRSISVERQQHFTRQAQAQAQLREKWSQQFAQNAAASGGMVMVPPRQGGQSGQNPYIGYANQMPTQQQQAQQQRFPGQNPVFRVGATGGSGNNNTTEQGPTPQANAQYTAQQQQAILQQQQQQQHYFQQQQNSILAAVPPQQLQQIYAMDAQTRHNWMQQQIQLRQEAQKRQSSQQRIKQQAVMHKTAQAAKETKTAAPAKKKKKKYDDSDDESLHLHDNDSDDDNDDDDDDADGGGDSEDEAEREAQAIKWFNEATAEELIEMTACKPEGAEAVIEMRPYESPSDIRTKLRKRKGISGNLFDNYVDLMHSYQQTDDCLMACTEIGNELMETMSIWTGGRKIAPTASMRPSPSVEPEEKPGQTKKEEASGNSDTGAKPAESSGASLTVPKTENGEPTLTAENAANVGSNLVSMSEDVLQASIGEDASEEVKAAFEDYLYEQPKMLSKDLKLKAYQMLGVNWLNLLYRKGISCILADEMGLGKTAQVIALFAHLKEIGKAGPHLVIVPSSTLDNWIREFERFAPDMKVYAYYGTQAERADARFFLKQEKDLDVIVTTYNMATGAADDKKFLRKMDFKACVFDEGHQLKNAESKKYKDLMEIKVKWRLLLTGTPLQNNLQELVSLLSFILPRIFSDAQESLRAIFKVPPEAQKNLLTRQRVHAAKKVMTPFVLRRKKAQVLQDLPKKTEIVEYCEMTAMQREIYRETIAKHKKAVIEYQPSGTNTPAEEAKPAPKKKGRAAAKTGKPVQENSTSNILMQLRKAANHPMLFRRLYDNRRIKQMAKDCLKEEEFADRNVDYIYEDMDLMTDFELHRFVQPYKYLRKYSLKKEEWMDSGKVQKLKQMLPEIKARGDRVLIFSQFVQVLDIMAQVLQTMDLKYLTLTGQTNVNDRQGLVDQFTEDKEITCFLLSTRAGGLGLNLMAANVVIILDMDFNPHNDKQAGDRAYRMGQTKDVTIYKFVTKGTIEEDMLELATTKLTLDEQVSSEAAVSGEVAEKIGVEEGDEGVIEKKIKTSLLTTLKKRFEGDDDAYQATHPGAEEELSDSSEGEDGDGEEEDVNMTKSEEGAEQEVNKKPEDSKDDGGEIKEDVPNANPKIEVDVPDNTSELSSIPSARSE